MATHEMPTTNRVALARFALQMAEIKQKIGGRMRELRTARKAEAEARGEQRLWTQDYCVRQLADGTIQPSQWSRWERGENRPEDDTLEEIADLFDTTVADLIAGPTADRQKGPTPDPFAKTSGEADDDRVQELRDEVDSMRLELTERLDAVLDALGVEHPRPEPTARGAEGTGT